MQTTETRSPSFTEREAAEYLGLSPSTLSASRLQNPRCEGPPYVKMGHRVRYLVADLDAWLASRRRTPGIPKAV